MLADTSSTAPANEVLRMTRVEPQGLNMDAKEIVAANVFSSPAYDEKSFAGVLHERGIWQEDQYWLLEAALYALAHEKTIAVNLYTEVFLIFNFVINAICPHLDQDDLYEIENLDREKVYDLRERIRMVFEGFFVRKMPDQEACFEERNPLLESGAGN
ncbi:Imm41 family immunity protein [Burkholderia cenocepacia]|uniref:Imm41 family immunity protein n=2 Tax=Burkholderia cenocepacia TaxID=95486 RepID=UPI0018A6B92D|nr:Imm41 family immunity protein [Burkholderia cenocepacia]